MCEKRKEKKNTSPLVRPLSGGSKRGVKVPAFAHRCRRSVVELSEAACFERQYSSITDAIADGLVTQNWIDCLTVVYNTLLAQKDQQNNPPWFVLDGTGFPRLYAISIPASPDCLMITLLQKSIGCPFKREFYIHSVETGDQGRHHQNNGHRSQTL